MDEMEKSLIKEELLPEVKDALSPVLNEVESPLTLIINYTPGSDVQVALAGEKSAKAATHQFKPQMVFTHELNWSEFLYGMTIDTRFHESVFKAVGRTIKRGESVPVKVIIDDIEYECRFENADRKVKGNTIRLMYKGKDGTVGTYLQSMFPDAYNYLLAKKREFGTRKQFALPDDMKITLTISTTKSPLKYTMVYNEDKTL